MATNELIIEERTPYEFDISDSQPVTFTEDQYIAVRVTYDTEPYEGSYEITPAVSEQVLATRNKTLFDDLTVLGIPYHQVTNDSGGYTVSIAS